MDQWVVLDGETWDAMEGRTLRLDEAWAKATDAIPRGMFGPAVEPRFSGRWRAWFYWPAPDTRDSISAFGASETEALLNLVAEVKG